MNVTTKETLSMAGMRHYNLSVDGSKNYQLIIVDYGYGFEFSSLSSLLLAEVVREPSSSLNDVHTRALRIKITALLAQADKEEGISS